MTAEVVEGTATEVPADRALTVVPGGTILRLSDSDRQTVFSLVTAQLGEQGQSVSTEEFTYFLRVAELRGLNPLFREVHLIKDKTGRINVQTGIDGFRKLAEDTGEYLGQTEPVWGEPYEGTVPEWQGKPGYCKVGVLRRGWDKPLYGEAWLDEDGATKDEWADNHRTGRRIASAQWAQRPRTMLKKVAEARAIRAAFPRQTAGLYTDDELHAPAGATETGAGGSTGASGGWTPPEAPPGVQGVVEKAPDGVRQSKVKRLGDSVHPKLELVMKVSGRRVTAILLDAVAEAAASLDLAEGEAVRVEGGAIEEIEWQAGKPKKKELWGATGLHVLRDGSWVTATGETSSSSTTEEQPSSSSTAAASPPSSSSTTPTAAAAAGPSDAGTQPARMVGREDDTATLSLRLVSVERSTTPRGKRVAVIRAADPATGEIVQAVLGDEPPGEIEAQLGPEHGAGELREGEEVVLVGTWKSGWLILAAVGRKAAPASDTEQLEAILG